MKNDDLKKKSKLGKINFDIKKFFQENKKSIVIVVAAFVVVVLVIVGVVLLLGKSNSEKLEKKFENRLGELAKNFYEVQYYPNLVNRDTSEPMTDEEKKEFAKKYKDTGINISLSSLARLYGEEKDSILEEFKVGDKACNYENTNVVIYPKDPYTINSYELKINIDCNFGDEK